MDYLLKDITMTSNELAELTGKRHDNVMRDIKNEIEALGENNALIFEVVDYTDAKGEKRPCYKFGKDGAMQLALKYDAITRRKVIVKLNELEFENSIPTHAEALRLYADKLEENQRLSEEKKILLEENKVMKPKAQLHDTFLAIDSAQTMNECAKALKIGRNKLFSFLREQKILMKNNLPYQSYIDRECFTVREVVIYHSDYQDIKSQTLVTTKGIDFIARMLKGE